MRKVAVIITISAGSSTSSGCLEECSRQIDAIEAEGSCTFSIFLNNEGPAGFSGVWEKASSGGFDFYIWLDYDLSLKEGALSVFFENSGFLRHKAIIAGTVAGPDGSLVSGGRSRHGRLLEPDQTIPVPCHLYDMDMLFVPEYAVEHLETPADIFKQSFFDYGSGSKVAKRGVARVIAPGVLARVDRAPEVPEWKNSEYSAYERFRSLMKAVNHELARLTHSLFS